MIPDDVHPVVFDVIDGESIRKAMMHTKGGAGPSGMDADGWRYLILSKNFKDANSELRDQLALATMKLATEMIEIKEKDDHPTSNLEGFLACRLLPLDKDPGLRPIGVGEVLRRVIGKVFMRTVRNEVQEVSGSLQVCVGQPGGCEAAVHAMKECFDEEDSDAILLIDARNAFNSLNRATMLENIRRICLILYVFAAIQFMPNFL